MPDRPNHLNTHDYRNETDVDPTHPPTHPPPHFLPKARAARLTRLIRLIRLVRFVRLLKFSARLGRRHHKDGDVDGEQHKDTEQPSRIGQTLAQQMSQRVVLLVLAVLFVTPFMNETRDPNFPMMMT